MTTENQTPAAPESDEIVLDELTVLKQRADLMGIAYSNNIGIDALKTKINQKQLADAKEEAKPEVNALTGKTEPNVDGLTPGQIKAAARQEMYDDQTKLIRLSITNTNPAKSDLPGEIFTLANDLIGTVRKFIPYGEESVNGYHVPNWIYQQMLARQYQQTKVVKDKGTGQERVIRKMAKEFSLEVLPQLTQAELDKLAAAQKAAGSV